MSMRLKQKWEQWLQLGTGTMTTAKNAVFIGLQLEICYSMEG